jgi:SagB-type dehydrogenase family enzyme
LSKPPTPQGPAQVIDYHQATKHAFNAYARGPGYLDWATQPDPFRRYHGAPLIELEHPPPDEGPLFETALEGGGVPPAPLNRHSLARLFFDSLALSAWKQAGEARWALRVNPSSGNLHPTEGYLVCGPVAGLAESGMVAHYAPHEHALELRAHLPRETWASLAAQLPPRAALVGLTSIHWREAWKYGERAYRYCQHDAGHAIAALSFAAAGLGWQAALLDGVGTQQLATLLGVSDSQGAEPEHPDCLLAVFPQGQPPAAAYNLAQETLAALSGLDWSGRPNRLSPRHVDWPIIEETAAAALKPPTEGIYAAERLPDWPILSESGFEPASLRRLIRQRRSAVAMDGRTSIGRDTFYHMLRATLPAASRFPFNALPWSPRVHLALFVHRVRDLAPGLYCLVRDPARREALRSSMRDDFDWERPDGCPPGLDLYRLAAGDARPAARQASCHQDIAADGCFSLGMLADFEGSLQQFGAWFYPRLFWECGVIGQALYLAAEAAGVRGTGIGCFFDDPVHRLLGLAAGDVSFQSLYHFTAGGPLEDWRLSTLPAYPGSQA